MFYWCAEGFRFEWRKRPAQGSPRFTPFQIAHEVSNWRGIARRAPANGFTGVDSGAAVPGDSFKRIRRPSLTLMFLESQSCVQSLMPHLGYPPSWYLKRKTTQRIDE